jgi:hypothetical protein
MRSTTKTLIQRLAAAWMTALLTATAWAADLGGGTACAFENQQAVIPVSFTNDGSIAALQFDLSYDASALSLDGLTYTGGSDHVVDWNLVSDGWLRVLLYSPTNALVPDGDIVEATFTTASGGPGGTLPLPFTQAYLATLGAATRAPGGGPAEGEVELAQISGPFDTVVCNGAAASLGVTVTGPGTTTYQWMKNGQPIGGATSSSLDVATVENSTIGIYQVEVQNTCGTATSEMAVLNLQGVCAPQALTAFDPGTGGELALRWQANPSEDVNAYRVLWGTQPDGPYTFQREIATVDRLNLDGLADGTRYYFRVSALVDTLESPFSNESDAAATAGGLDLPQAADFGYQTTPSNDTSHPDVVTYRFPGRRDAVTLWFDVYDVDFQGEVSVKINGTEVHLPAATPTSSWAGKTTIELPDDLVDDTETNVLTFDNLSAPPGVEVWGVRTVSLKLDAPVVTTRPWSETVDLTIAQPQREPSLGGYDIHRGTFAGFLPTSANRIAAGVQGTSYRDQAGLLDGRTYHYVVRPVDTIANAGFDSIEVAATPSDTLVTPIHDLHLSKSGSDDVLMEWSPVFTSSGVQAYRIYEGSAVTTLTHTGVDTTQTSHVRSGDLSDGQVHFYWIGVQDTTGQESGE